MKFINATKFFYLKKVKNISLPKDLIEEAVKKNKNKISITEKEDTFTYQEVYERGKKLANSLLKLGLKKGDSVALLMYNCREYFEIRVAAYLSGLVLCPLVPDTLLEDIIFILNDCDIRAIIYHKDLFDDRMREDTRIQFFILLQGGYEPLISGGELKDIKPNLKPEDLASINFSSGTTGRPKGIMLTQGNWISSFYNYVLNSPRATKGGVKMLHIMSLATAGGAAFLPSFFLGMENFFLDKFDEAKIVGMIMKQGVNTIFITPSWLSALIDYCKCNKIKPPLKNIVIGTEPISRDKFKEAIEFFGPIVQQGYGMAEVLPPLSLICSKDYLNGSKINEQKLIFAGRAVRGVEVKVVDKKDKIGRMVIKSQTVSSGYWNMPEMNKKYFLDGRFVSDDFGYIDKEGYLYISGRAQDIISLDKMIFRRDVEEILHEHPSVLEAYTFFKKGKIFAFVSLKKSAKSASEEELLSFYNNRPKKISVDLIKILPVLPKNFSGKINAKKLLSMAEAI
jgi:acyl-CoA synthetase (AMP-forming)/AMP-acid ligase II